MDSTLYLPSYNKSYALIIGIDSYLNASPLGYAVNDAEAVAEIIESQFEFPRENITLLLNADATKERIMTAFLSFAGEGTSSDDKILVFFAGHGMTQEGRRGEVGFLVPYDGDRENLSTLVRWDDLTLSSELISAKHILFVMDACYSGLAITRALPVGSMRFLKDMLQRYSRQVLTAGKANEAVADSGGPIANHSVFTGHFLQGLQGKASSEDGIITANGVMAYVYGKVAKDIRSRQTPHYGFFDGDGDFIFKAPNIESLSEKDKIDEDILISVPTPPIEAKSLSISDVIDKTKEYISESRYKIKLSDMFNQQLREVIALLADDQLKVQSGNYNTDEFVRRIKKYEDIVKVIQAMIACVAHWANDEHNNLLKKIISRISDNIKPEGGLKVWLNLRWYPIILLLYSAGISAIASGNFSALSALLKAKVQSPENSNQTIDVTLALGHPAARLNDPFKELSGHKNQYVPRSEYMFKLLQPMLDDLLFLGRDYENLFDRFEIFLSLTYADIIYKPDGRIWGPLGRFGWKYANGMSTNTFSEFVTEANSLKNEWPPLKAGLFNGDIERFIEISTKYEENILKELSWW